MDSRGIFQQFIVGAFKAREAIAELEKSLGDATNKQEKEEAARARYVIGFLHRILQFQEGKCTEKDLCLCLRDLILVIGRIRLTEKLYRIAKAHEHEFDLICEGDCQVSCMIHIPSWITPQQYVNDVYGFKQSGDGFIETSSVGDDILQQNTIFKKYKSFEQKLAVKTALSLPDGYTLLVSQPTGGGKSLVTQILSSSSYGLTIVVVPTVALALDQFYAASNILKNNTQIYCYRGEQSESDRTAIINAIQKGNARILFTSPEAILKNTALFNVLAVSANSGYLRNVVVDEAHVVPDWGVFFRPDFQVLSIVLRKWRELSKGAIRTFLLSATLSNDVVETLFTLFGQAEKNVQLRCDSLRQEPRFYFYSAKSRAEQHSKVLDAICYLPKPMVVYVLEPREAKEIKKQLNEQGYQNIPVFTGETSDLERNRILTGWKCNEYDVILATSAFGIGVDKPDVRTIIHACCPENLSRYYQEVGRGGRDGLPSISLFIPYQSASDKDADVRRALGLVNKRVLTVERAVIRWNSMIAHSNSIVEADICTLDTSATPSSMSEEEAEYAGNRNVAWNINLLLFFHRVGLINLLDASYSIEKKSYLIKARILNPSIMGSPEKLAAALEKPREHEYASQMEGYYIIRDLVASPKANCWGRTFRHLFPLSKEVCNGCPSDLEGRVTTDAAFKLRIPPELILPPKAASAKLSRNMGSFSSLLISRKQDGMCSKEEVIEFAQHAAMNNIGAIVVPKRLENCLTYPGTVLNYDEFFFAIANAPYLFSEGVACVFENNSSINNSLYKNLNRLEKVGYRRVLFCHEEMMIASLGRSIQDCFDGNTISIERF